MTTTCDDIDCLKCHPLDGPAVPLELALSPAYREGVERGKQVLERALAHWREHGTSVPYTEWLSADGATHFVPDSFGGKIIQGDETLRLTYTLDIS